MTPRDSTFVKLRRGLLDHAPTMSMSEFKLFIVILLMADHRSHQVVASMRELVSSMGVVEKTVRTALSGLREKGYVTMVPASNQWGGNTITVTNYSGAVEMTAAQEVGAVNIPCGAVNIPCGAVSGGGVFTAAHPNLPAETLLRNKKKKEEIHQTMFDAWWEAYPRKVGKGAAKSKYLAALSKVDEETLLTSLRSYHFSDEARYIPHPATWLNQERWLDEDAAASTTDYFSTWG